MKKRIMVTKKIYVLFTLFIIIIKKKKKKKKKKNLSKDNKGKKRKIA